MSSFKSINFCNFFFAFANKLFIFINIFTSFRTIQILVSLLLYWRDKMTETQKQNIQILRSQGLGYKSIATRLGISVNTVKSYLKKHSSDFTQPTDLTTNTSFCLQCGKELVKILHKKEKKFCCDKCRYEWWNKNRASKRVSAHTYTCPVCKTVFTSYSASTTHYCSHKCYINRRFGR